MLVITKNYKHWCDNVAQCERKERALSKLGIASKREA